MMDNLEVGDIIYKGDDNTLITAIIDDRFIVGVTYSDNHRMYKLTKGIISEYKEWEYEKTDYMYCFEEDNEYFIKFLEQD